MLYVKFVIDNDRYLLATDQVVTLMPIVMVQAVSATPDYFPGNINFRGKSVPVIDIVQLLKGRAARQRLSTRIIVITMNSSEGKRNKVGLLVEKVIGLVNLDDAYFTLHTDELQGCACLDAVANDEDGELYRVCSEKLLPSPELDVVLSQF
jgi:chemotaxis-related protein WspB